VLTEGYLVLQLLEQRGHLLLRIEALEAQLTGGGYGSSLAAAPARPVEGLPLGAPAPGFRLSGLHNEPVTLEAPRALDKPVLLLFTDPHCGPCNALLSEIGHWQRDHVREVVLAVISQGPLAVNQVKRVEHGLTHVLLQQDREVAEAYQVYGTPSAVLIHPDGTIGSPVAAVVEAIRALVAQTVGTPAARALEVHGGNGQQRPSPNGGDLHPESLTMSAGRKIGELAPELALLDLTGTTRTLTEFRWHRILVLFRNPGCGFCQRMLEELKAWEAEPPVEAPRLLVVSSGTVEANQAMGLQSVVVLDQGFSVGQAFGASGTPSAVLVDATGTIASELAVGAPEVLALVQGRDPATAS
jgi:peroxiredoxin